MRLKPSSFLQFCLVIDLFAFLLIPPPLAQAKGQITGGQVEYTFGGQISFHAQVQAESPVKEALVEFRPQGEPQTVVQPAQVDPNGEISLQYEISSHPLRAFSTVEYWFKVTLEDGEQITSPTYSFYYEDNRYTWQVVQRGPFQVHWYDGDEAFAQGVLDVAEEGLKHIHSLLQLPDPKPINIYAYASSQEMQATLRLSGQSWIAGHADPDLRVMVVSLPSGPEQRVLMEERIPHEMMHIMLYQSIGEGYNRLPAWLNEGLASIAELVPNPDYRILLDSAVQKGTLIPFASLCQNFPVDNSGAALSYAQAASFTYYLYQQYGATVLQSLMSNYANGLACERGFEAATGSTLALAQEQWQKSSLGSPAPVQASPGDLLPWLAVSLAVFAVPLVMIFAGLLHRKGSATKPEKITV